MSDTMTIEIESVDGEPIDMDAISEALRDAGVKAKGWRPGLHLLTASALERAVEGIESAARMVEGCAESPDPLSGLDLVVTMDGDAPDADRLWRAMRERESLPLEDDALGTPRGTAVPVLAAWQPDESVAFGFKRVEEA